MRFRIEDPRAAKDLVRFFRRRDYLAVQADDGSIEVVSIQSVSERGDRTRTLRDLDEWKAANPDVTVETLDGPAPL